MPRNYVNNSMNRSLGRVGMPVGSMPVSSGGSRSSGGGYSSGHSGSGRMSSTSSSSSNTYVDNAYNRSLGRVGMEHGSMVVSRSGTSSQSGNSSSSSRTYVDNESNRRLGRVGMPLGSMKVSQSGASQPAETVKTYKDNPMNRSLGRVGKAIGTSVFSDGGAGARTAQKTYVDNEMNRRLGRVGMPLGSMPSRSEQGTRLYKDNSFNRNLGRVGKPVGTATKHGLSKETEALRKIIENLRMNPESEIDFPSDGAVCNDEYDNICDSALAHISRMNQINRWKQESKTADEPKTAKQVLQEFTGTIVDFKEVILQNKIGNGRYGDVFFAKWKGTVVAAKKMRVQRVSQRCLKLFAEEIKVLCQLDHPNVIKLIGACVKTPNLCILMEYMQTSLYEALHVTEEDFTEAQRIEIIAQTSEAMSYLHMKDIAHCDVKSCNVLLDYKEGAPLVAKITDFGLSMMKNEIDTSTSSSQERVRNFGTPRYSAPEVLRGDLLGIEAVKKTDMYSFSLVVYEVVYEEEPFYNLNYHQLKENVGNKGYTPTYSGAKCLTKVMECQLKACWSRNPDERPSAFEFASFAKDLKQLYK